MTNKTLAERAAEIRWWHGGMDLGNGVITRGESHPANNLLPRVGLPADLTGKTVLDIGTADGFMAFECERRGTAKVVAVDSFVTSNWVLPFAWATGRAGFDLAHEALGSNVQAVECEVLDLDPADLGTFDVVLFLGVLYHMRHPLLALERAAAMTHDLLIVESYIVEDDSNIPAMRFFPGNELNNDPTNWWGPNVACIEAMLQVIGFSSVELVSVGNTRAVVHARRNP